MSSVSTRWILAYDLHCGGCSALAERVAERSGGRIEIADLSNSEVQRLRSVAFEGRPPWAPTLLQVGPAGVRAWSGMGLRVRLLWRLGPRRAWAVVKALGDREGPDTGRRRLLKVLTSGLFGMAAGLGWIGVEGGHRDKKGLARGEVPGIRTWRTVGTERKLLADAQTRTASLSRADGLAIDAAKSFAWERSTLVEYEGGAAAVVVPAIDSHQTELERTYVLLGYDTRNREIGGALLLAMRRRSTDDNEPVKVDFATLSGHPIVGFEMDQQAREMRKVVHDPPGTNEPLILAMDSSQIAYHNYWHCVGICLRRDWDKLPWYMQGACFGACNGCMFSGAWWGCAICAGCLGGYAAHCLFSHC